MLQLYVKQISLIFANKIKCYESIHYIFKPKTKIQNFYFLHENISYATIKLKFF